MSNDAIGGTLVLIGIVMILGWISYTFPWVAGGIVLIGVGGAIVNRY